MAAGELYDRLFIRFQERHREGNAASRVPVEEALYISYKRSCGVIVRRSGVQAHCDDDGPRRSSSRRGQRQQSIASEEFAIPDREMKTQSYTYDLNMEVMADSLGSHPFRSTSWLPIVYEDGVDGCMLLAIRCNGGRRVDPTTEKYSDVRGVLLHKI